MKKISEPLRITTSGNYELYDYIACNEISLSGALLLSSNLENDLTTIIKIINKKSKIEFDRLMLMAFTNPTQPTSDKIEIKGKFFNPKTHYLKIEPKNNNEDIQFLLYFSAMEN